MEANILIPRVWISEQEDFDSKLICYSAFEKLAERVLAIDLSRSLVTIKAELLNDLLCLACELQLELSKFKCYPQVRPLYEKLKYRHEFTGQFKPILFNDANEEEMSSNAASAYFLYYAAPLNMLANSLIHSN